MEMRQEVQEIIELLDVALDDKNKYKIGIKRFF